MKADHHNPALPRALRRFAWMGRSGLPQSLKVAPNYTSPGMGSGLVNPCPPLSGAPIAPSEGLISLNGPSAPLSIIRSVISVVKAMEKRCHS